MRAMVVEVGPEIEQLVFEIASRPEQWQPHCRSLYQTPMAA